MYSRCKKKVKSDKDDTAPIKCCYRAKKSLGGLFYYPRVLLGAVMLTPGADLPF